MPPKKKGAKAKSATVQAMEAELAQEVVQMRFEKEQERVRNEEFMLRQRLEEEEYKLLEDLRVREVEISNAIAERDRQANYVAREQELTVLLEQRERDTQELRAKVLGLQQAQTALEKEKESAVRRTTMLVGELETARQMLTEAQEKAHEASAAHHQTCSSMQSEHDSLRAEVVAARDQHEGARAENMKLQEQLLALEAKLADEGKHLTSSDGSVEHIAQLNPRSCDAESAVLLNVLHAEVEKYKEIAAGLQSDLDRRSRDEEKSSLLVGILNTQLDSVREENKRLHAKSMKALEEADAVRKSVELEKQRNRDLYEEMDHTSSEAAVAHRQLMLEVGVHRKQVEELTGRLEALTTSYDELQKQHSLVSTRAAEREQDDFRANVSMKLELDRQKLDLARLLKEKQETEDEAFNYKVLTRAEMDGLKSRLQKFQETMERKDRESYETVHVLREEATRRETERQRQVNSLALEKERLTNNLADTCEERDRVSRELSAKSSSFAAREKDMYEKLVHMTACHDAKHQEVEQLRGRLQEKEEAYTNNSIFLNAEKENLRAQLTELSAEAQKRRAEHLAHVERLTAELTEVQTRMSADATSQDTMFRREKERAEMAERNVKRLHDQIRDMEANTRSTELTTADVVKALKTDARELRSELAIARRTVERLEAAFGDQAGYHQLKELNERLSKEGESYRAQVAHLNSVVAAMKMEEDVMGGYRLRRANDEVERLSRTVRQLEQAQKLTLPLFDELRAAAVERAGLGSSLRASLEQYDAQMAAMGQQQKSHVDTFVPSSSDAATTAIAADTKTSEVEVDAAGDVVEKSDMTSTLPAILQPRPPSGPRSRIVEAFFDKKALRSGNTSSSTSVAARPAASELPNLVA